MKKLFLSIFIILLICSASWAGTATSVTQYGVTWTFDKAYEVGQFANGDWWVQNNPTVTITAISPAFNSARKDNGWMVNPIMGVPTGYIGSHGFIGTMPNYDPNLVPSLPYTSPSSGTTSVLQSTPNILKTGTFTSDPSGQKVFDSAGGWIDGKWDTATTLIITSGTANNTYYNILDTTNLDDSLTLTVIGTTTVAADPYADGVRSGDTYAIYDTRCVLKSIAVLTIVTETPSATSFRPPYTGASSTKVPSVGAVYYDTSSILTNQLLNIATPLYDNDHTWAEIEAMLVMPQIDLGASGSDNERLNALDNNGSPTGYKPDILSKYLAALAKLNASGTLADKTNSLIYLMQAGIDYSHAVASKLPSPATFPEGGGGEYLREKIMCAYAGYMMNNSAMKAQSSADYWYENSNCKDALWMQGTTEADYWAKAAVYYGSTLHFGDPYRYIDGSMTQHYSYDAYLTYMGGFFKKEATLLRWIPALKAIWSDADNFIAFAERWESNGVKSLPDPCAPVTREPIDSVTRGNPTIITRVGHSVLNGDKVRINRTTGIATTERTATVTSADTFTIPLDTTVLPLILTVTADSFYSYGNGRTYGSCSEASETCNISPISGLGCISGSGRFPLSDGLLKDYMLASRLLASIQMEELWDAYETTNYYALTVTKSGTGTGTIVSSPSGIDCGDTCSANFASGNVTLTATPASGNGQGAWTGACAGTAASDPCTVTMSEARAVDKEFLATPTEYTLVVSHTGTGTGVTSPVVGTYGYQSGAAITVTQTADANSTFTGWSGGVCTGTGACTFNKAVTDELVIAEFTEDATYRLSISYPSNGELIYSEETLLCGGDNSSCVIDVYSGSTVSLTGTCAVGYYNLVWSGDGTGTTTRSFSMTGNETVSVSSTNGRAATVGGSGTMALGGSGTITLE